MKKKTEKKRRKWRERCSDSPQIIKTLTNAKLKNSQKKKKENPKRTKQSQVDACVQRDLFGTEISTGEFLAVCFRVVTKFSQRGSTEWKARLNKWMNCASKESKMSFFTVQSLKAGSKRSALINSRRLTSNRRPLNCNYCWLDKIINHVKNSSIHCHVD